MQSPTCVVLIALVMYAVVRSSEISEMESFTIKDFKNECIWFLQIYFMTFVCNIIMGPVNDAIFAAELEAGFYDQVVLSE